MDSNLIKKELIIALEELIEKANLKENDILVLGCSSSEIQGDHIGKNTNLEIGELVIDTILPILSKNEIHLAVQGCEHINRALTIEKEVALQNNFEIVSVVPSLNAGGACSYVAYQRFENPVIIEHIVAKASLDIGDTSTGMHVKFVQIPIRLSIKKIGFANLTSLGSRPKLIGGPRACY